MFSEAEVAIELAVHGQWHDSEYNKQFLILFIKMLRYAILLKA